MKTVKVIRNLNIVTKKPSINNLSNISMMRLKAGIFDWSGTLTDECSIAPAYAFHETFRHAKCPISMQDARAPMGLSKGDHLKQILNTSQVGEHWQKQYHRTWNHNDFTLLLHNYEINQLACISRFSSFIPGAFDSLYTLKNHYGMKIGLTTGFPKIVSDKFLAIANRVGIQHYIDSAVASDEVKNGRPSPDGIHENLKRLDIDESQSHLVVKVDDTLGGIGEGKAAKTWTVGVYATSSYMNVDSIEQLRNMSTEEFLNRAMESKAKLLQSRPDFLIPSVRLMPLVVDRINKELEANNKPGKIETIIL